MTISHKVFLRLKFIFCIVALSLLAAPLFAQDINEGKTLFKNNCAQCHAKNMTSALTGPALVGWEERWPDRDKLYAWVRNSQEVIASGDAYANELYNTWNKTLMNPFPDLTDAQIDNIFAYVDNVLIGDGPVVDGPKVPDCGAAALAALDQPAKNKWMYWALFGVLALLAIVLARIISSLNQVADVQHGDQPVAPKSLAQILTSRSVIGFAIFALVVLGGYTTVNNAIALNRQVNYAPEQPIKFSHATHACEQKIDCQYCHDGARRSKHSVIPATNTCMNCHKAVTAGAQYGAGEITKIYASAAYDPVSKAYYDPDTMEADAVEEMYRKWLADQYVEIKGLDVIDAKGEGVVAQQWDDLVSSLTNDTKKSIHGPIPWIRVHNLPDHVFFSHAQHVDVGEIECQTCHGPIETMDVVSQHAPLSMGWCVNCHRQTDVKFADNEYYKSYEQFHKELKEGKRTSVTVEDIGGLECQKCHY